MSKTSYRNPDKATESDTNNQTTNRTQCPECHSKTTTTDGELVCTNCALVIDDTQIDHGPEWRAFTASEHESKSRVGSPTTNTIHDKGLSTRIDWQDRDSYGKNLSPKKRRKMHRLRKINKRMGTHSGKERGLKFALGEIDRMTGALGLPESTQETASMVFRQAQQHNLLVGRSMEGVASAALYTAARKENLPRSLDEISSVSRVNRREIQRTYRYLCKEIGLAVPNANPQQFIPRYSSDLGLSDELEQLSRNILDAYYEDGHASGKNPTGLAASAIYSAGLISGDKYTQSEIADTADVTTVTIRNRYQDMIDVYSKVTDTPVSID